VKTGLFRASSLRDLQIRTIVRRTGSRVLHPSRPCTDLGSNIVREPFSIDTRRLLIARAAPPTLTGARLPSLDANLNPLTQVTAMGMQILFALSGVNVLIAIALGAFIFLFGFVLNRRPEGKDQAELEQWKRDRPLQWMFLAVIIIVTVILIAER
jgi:hypothetical protein